MTGVRAARTDQMDEEEVAKEDELLRDRQHQRSQGGDVGLEGMASNGHELLRQGSTTNPEQAIWDQHGTLIAKVPVLSNVLGTHNQSPAARVDLHAHNSNAFTFVFIALTFSSQKYKQEKQLIFNIDYQPHFHEH
ncbi:MAG: hypothetical protein FRX49_05566 [Trebouxia sp. A1-2]|nr:MAG: hypothetical protein FRX49_05566 [Trebouxia sp. A1-2]